MNNTTLPESQEAVLQTAIEILQQLGGSAQATAVYEQFGKILGHDLDETEANNVYQVMTQSTAAACLLQKNGQCLYINSANDETFTLEENEDKKGAAAPADASMKQALEQPNDPVEYTTVPTDQAKAVVEPDELVRADSPAGKLADDTKDLVHDLQADADALIDEAKADKDPDHEDRKIDSQSRRIDHEQHVIQTEEERIARHEEQIKKDRTGFMKDLHEMEIHHDEKVIAREEAREKKLEDKIIEE